MKSYKTPHFRQSSLKYNVSKQGETLETKVERMVHNKEPIKDGAPILHTERKEGVVPSTNIRTDRFEIAVDAATKIAKSFATKRAARQKEREEVGKPESIQGDPQAGKGPEVPTKP